MPKITFISIQTSLLFKWCIFTVFLV